MNVRVLFHLALLPFDCVDIFTEDDSFYCFPTKENVVTKLAFATEEIFRMHQTSIRGKQITKSL